jgi:hypothetical protein
MRNIVLLLLMAGIIIFYNACQKDAPSQNAIEFHGLKVKEIETNEKMIEGFPTGIDFDRKILFVESTLQAKRKFLIKLIDWNSFEIKNSIELPAGDYQSPTEYFNPVHIEFIDNRYYVVDQFEKIVVYDKKFNHLYSSMYHQLRFFIDIFKHNNQVFFTVGTKTTHKKTACRTKLFQLEENKKPIERQNISKVIEFLSFWNKDSTKRYYVGYFWPALHGFEKNGCIYYAVGNTQDLYVYDLNSAKMKVYALIHLKPKIFKNEDAHTLGYHNTNGWEEKLFKKFGDKVIYEAYPDNVFHFGIYDIGREKIGVAADVNIENMTFRLDVIDIKHWEYKESIWLPMNYGFKKTLATNYRGLVKGYINIDEGIYIHLDTVGEDFDFVAKIKKFKIK